jgi:hypothetical protein
MAWLAGFTAGEGYVDLDSTARLVWTNTHRDTLEAIQARVGGSMRTLSYVEGSRKPRYQLAVYGGTARDLLKTMLPLLGEKRAQAELVLSYVPLPRGYPTTRERRLLRASIRTKLKELRHRAY